MAMDAREHYKQESKKDVNTDEIIMSVDLQKFLMLPRLPGLKNAIYCKRLVAFNESFVPVGQKNGKGIGVLWHERTAGRPASAIASTFINILRSPRFRDMKHVIF